MIRFYSGVQAPPPFVAVNIIDYALLEIVDELKQVSVTWNSIKPPLQAPLND